MHFHYTVTQGDKFSDCIAQIEAFLPSETESIILLATSDNTWNMNEVSDWLRQSKMPIAGGFFPGVIAAEEKYQHNTIVALCSTRPLRKSLVNGLSKGENFIYAQLSQYIGAKEEGKPYLVLIDGLSQNIERFTDVFYRTMGESTATIGGGAGSLDFIRKPCLFTENGIAEDIGIMRELGAWLVKQVLADFKVAMNCGLPPSFERISINISPNQLEQRNVVEWLTDTLQQFDVPAERVCLELTENGFVGNVEPIIQKIRRLTELGIHVAIDDFGKGYSSLRYL